MSHENCKKLGVRALIVRSRQLLMVQHKEKSEHFMLFPGGGINLEESIFEAAEREVREEANIEVRAEKIVYARETKMGLAMGIEFYVFCTVVSGEIKLGHDPEKDQQVLEGVSWVDISHLGENKNWYPLELHQFLSQDADDNFSTFRYLGVYDFSKIV